MLLKMYAIYDSKMEAYLQPIFARANGEALRMFAAAINEEDHNFNKNAADFTMMIVGEWDDQTAEVTNYKANVSLGNAMEFRDDPAMKEMWTEKAEENLRQIAKGNGSVRGGE